MGMAKGLEIGKILKDVYNHIDFRSNLNSLEQITCPVLQTKTLSKYGLKRNNKKQEIQHLNIFPVDYFCPMNQYTGKCMITDNTYSKHLYAATWFDSVDRERRKLRVVYSKYGKLMSNVISTIIAYKKEYGFIKMWKFIFIKLF